MATRALPKPERADAIPGSPDVALSFYRPSPTDYRLKMLVYGDPGVGKTTLAATALNVPQMADILILNIEGGIMSVVEASEVGLHQTPMVKDISSMHELEEVFWYLRTAEHPYRTLVIDSYSELTKICLDAIVEHEVETSTKRHSIDEIWLDDYGTMTKRMRRVTKAIRDLPMHVILTCHAAATQDKDKNEKIVPSLTNKLRESVVGYMDIVAYMYTQIEETEEADKKLVRGILTQPYGKWDAKDRSPGGRIGIFLENPTMPIIFERITRTRRDENGSDF